MAIIKLGPTVAGIRGTVAGLTFSANASGPYIMQWSQSSRPRTLPQSLQRGRLGQMGAAWAALSSAQRAAWDTYAADSAQELTNSLGEAYYASGYNWFCSCNTQLLNAGLSTISTAPSGGTPSAPTITGLTFEDDSGSVKAQVTYGASEFASDETIVIFASLVRGQGRSVQYSGFFLMAAEEDPGASPYDFSTACEDKFGYPNDGDTLFVRVYRQSDEGRRSSVVSLDQGFS